MSVVLRRISISLIAAGVIALAGCATLALPPPAESDRVWTYITVTKPYKQWAFWPDNQDWQQGTQPHGAWLRTYVNATTLKATQPPLRPGSIIVKENHDTNRNLVSVTVMYKTRGYNASAGDWFWGRYAPDGKVDAAGKVASCIACHARVADNDYIQSHTFATASEN